MGRFRTFMIISTIFAIVWCGAGAFYGAIQNKISSAAILLALSYANIWALTYWVHYEKAVRK